MNGFVLDFERRVVELEKRIQEMKAFASEQGIELTDELQRLETRLVQLKQDTYSNLTRWQRLQLARHPDRPHTLDYIQSITTDFIELHGDRAFGDDAAMVAGLARLEGQSVVVVGQQKGKNTKENLHRNFGMAHPEGYRKALRVMQLGAKFKKPIITFIDTPAAYPGVGAEERGVAEAIARNIREMARMPVPVIVAVIGEGASGGAMGIGVGDRILMLENAWYSVIPPERCATILWKDKDKAAKKVVDTAEAMKITAADALALGAIDRVVPEPLGGAHHNPQKILVTLKQVLVEELQGLHNKSPETLLRERLDKFARMGVFREEIPARK